MAKPLILAATGAIALVGAGAYYVSPALQTDPDVPPLHTNLGPDAVTAELKKMSFRSFAQQVSAKDDLNYYITSKYKVLSDGQLQFDIGTPSESMVRLNVKLVPGSNGGTVVDIQPEFTNRAIAESGELHPYDVTVIQAAVDVMATEYVGSVLEKRRMANGEELQTALQERTGFDKEQWRAFGKRVEKAYEAAYGKNLQRRRSGSNWGNSAGERGGYGVTGQPDVDPEAAARAAERAADYAARRAAEGR
jgi:hypothetical protein